MGTCEASKLRAMPLPMASFLMGSPGAGISDAARRMRKLCGCSQMRSLLKALDARRSDADNGAILKAA
jgi:hypothetical protein